jgi:hypothetical protein
MVRSAELVLIGLCPRGLVLDDFDEVVRHVTIEHSEPELRNACEHLTLAGDRRGQHYVVRADAVSGHQQ